jgi:hypothetical protein
MLRRLVIIGMALALAVPVLPITPASAEVLFSCPAIDGGFFLLSPGLSHTQTAQNAFYDTVTIYSQPCSNGEQALFRIGSIFTDYGLNPTTSYPTRPLGCPVVWGGAGPDYPDRTPILLGPTDPSFHVHWYSTDSSSTGIAKVRQGSISTQWRLVFSITAGKYAPPAGMTTKIKVQVGIKAQRGNEPPFTCADDSSPVTGVNLNSVSSMVVQQK